MTRLPLPDGVTDDTRRHGVLAHEPRLLSRFLDLYGRLWRDGIVDQPTKEVARLRNARVTGCGYCRNVRFEGARRDGLGEDQVAMIDEGYGASSLSARHKATIKMTDVLLGRRDHVDAALAAELGAFFSPAEVVELGVTAALCLGFSKIAVALGSAPADMPVTVVPTPEPPQ